MAKQTLVIGDSQAAALEAIAPEDRFTFDFERGSTLNQWVMFHQWRFEAVLQEQTFDHVVILLGANGSNGNCWDDIYDFAHLAAVPEMYGVRCVTKIYSRFREIPDIFLQDQSIVTVEMDKEELEKDGHLNGRGAQRLLEKIDQCSANKQ